MEHTYALTPKIDGKVCLSISCGVELLKNEHKYIILAKKLAIDLLLNEPSKPKLPPDHLISKFMNGKHFHVPSQHERYEMM